MAQLFMTLDPLTVPAKTVSGADASAINIYRLTFGGFAPIINTDNAVLRVSAFIRGACKGVVRSTNGAGDIEEALKPDTVAMPDVAELVDAMVAMNAAIGELNIDGDGITHPIVYTLIHPLTLDANGTKLEQFEFAVRTLGAIAGMLNASTEAERFREFMRASATMIGVNLPITDSVVNALDIEDYATINSANIMGKLAGGQGRLKRAS